MNVSLLKSRRRVWLSASILCVAFAPGCGAEGESQEPPPRISAGDYREIERLYEAGIEAEQLQSRPRAALRVMTEACESVDRSRPLLKAGVAGCEELAALPAIAGVPDCGEGAKCASALREVADLVDEAVSTSEAARRTFFDILGDTQCAEALAPPPGYIDGFRKLGGAYSDLAVAVETGDEDLADTAGDDLARAARQLADGPSTTASLKRFRAHCEPAG